MGIRYDTFVRLGNALAATALLSHLFRMLGIAAGRFNAILAVLVVPGLGALIEILEYLVVLTVPDNGVGAYDSNMQDLIANCAGSVTFLALRVLWTRPLGRQRARQASVAATVGR